MLIRAEVHRIVDELTDEEFAEIAELLKRRGDRPAAVDPTAIDPIAYDGLDPERAGVDQALDDVAAGKGTTNRYALEILAQNPGRQPMTWARLIEFYTRPVPVDDGFADALEAVHNEQNKIEPSPWDS